MCIMKTRFFFSFSVYSFFKIPKRTPRNNIPSPYFSPPKMDCCVNFHDFDFELQIFWDREQRSGGWASHSLQPRPAPLHFYIPIQNCRRQVAQTRGDPVGQPCDFIRGLFKIIRKDYTNCWSCAAAIFKYPIVCRPAKQTACSF